MKKLWLAAFVLAMMFNYCTLSINADVGLASIHNPQGSNRKTASGLIWNDNQLVAAHKYYPLGSWIKIIDPKTKKEIFAQVIDRGPYKSNRILDLSTLAANHLGISNKKGLLKVNVIKL